MFIMARAALFISIHNVIETDRHASEDRLPDLHGSIRMVGSSRGIHFHVSLKMPTPQSKAQIEARVKVFIRATFEIVAT